MQENIRQKTYSPNSITAVHYSSDEILEQFQKIIVSFDFDALVKELGLGIFSIKKRRIAKQELRSLTIVLWYLALQNSFPHEAEDVLEKYKEKTPFLATPAEEKRLETYLAISKEKKEKDFSPLAAHFATHFCKDPKKSAVLAFRFSLHLRSIYQRLFSHLIPVITQ